MIIAIDFDGTIVEHAFPEIGNPIPRAIEAIQMLKMKKHKLILWTCRNSREQLIPVLKYCKKNGLKFDAINYNVKDAGFNPLPKIYYDLLIDDHAFPLMKSEDKWLEIIKAIEIGTL